MFSDRFLAEIQYGHVGNNLTLTFQDPNKQNDRTREFIVGFQQELMPRVGLELNYIWRKYDRFSWSPRSNFGSSDFSAVSVNPSNCSAQADCGSITYFVATSPQPSPYTATNQPDRHRDYNGLELSLTKRYSSRWLGTASFAYNDAQDYLGLGGSLPGPTNIHR